MILKLFFILLVVSFSVMVITELIYMDQEIELKEDACAKKGLQGYLWKDGHDYCFTEEGLREVVLECIPVKGWRSIVPVCKSYKIWVVNR